MTRRAPPLPPRGFVLLNALVLVVALAGAAALLLARAEGARARGSAGAGAAQLALYLDAAQALAATALRPVPGDAVDHPGEAWARPVGPVPLDRGQVALRIMDLQGRFNVNWLADAQDEMAAEAWTRLAASVGLSGAGARAVATRIAGSGPGEGPVVTLDQLAGPGGIDPASLARLRPLLAALPSNTKLNINTAPAEVLHATLPGLSRGLADRLAEMRKAEPFASVQAFTETLGRIAGVATAGEVDATRLDVGSSWFVLEARATLGARTAARRTMLERQPLPLGLRVAYRAAIAPAETGFEAAKETP